MKRQPDYKDNSSSSLCELVNCLIWWVSWIHNNNSFDPWPITLKKSLLFWTSNCSLGNGHKLWAVFSLLNACIEGFLSGVQYFLRKKNNTNTDTSLSLDKYLALIPSDLSCDPSRVLISRLGTTVSDEWRHLYCSELILLHYCFFIAFPLSAIFHLCVQLCTKCV